MADQDQLELLKQSVNDWNQWRRDHPYIRPDLRDAYLSKVDLSNAILSRTNLRGAILGRADLNGVDLCEADLFSTDLFCTNLRGAILSRANLTAARFCYTIFAEVDLSLVKGLETAFHGGPSIVDINSVILPTDEHTRKHFLRGVGFSDTAIEYLPSILTPAAIHYYSLFLSYAHQDEAVARRLYRDLQEQGVRCWMAPHDLRPGDYHYSRIDEAIHLHEKVLLLLSEYAVNSSWVKHEVQIALAREVTQDCTILFPLRLDQAVMQTGKDWAVRLRNSRHIGDFTDWQDDTAYQKAFATLLQHLKVSKPPTL